MTKIAGTHDETDWSVEVSYDCFTIGEPFVVDLWVENSENENGAFLSPDQARQLAKELESYADQAEKANARVDASYEEH